MGLKTTCLSLTAIFFVVFVFISIISDDIQGIELKGEDESQGSNKAEPRSKEKAKANIKKRESGGYQDEQGLDEINIGGKRFKLFEKKHLNYKKATAFCKKNEGKLAEAMNLEEMRRLQILLMRARSIGDDMWVGADKKEWKKHSLKMQRRPNFGPDPMLFGGGPTEMCPALSVSTRSLTPVQCTRELPFICEFGPPGTGKPGTKPKSSSSNKAEPVKKKSSSSSTKTTRSKASKPTKVEMRRRKREILLSTSLISSSMGDEESSATTAASADTEATSSNNAEDETTEMYVTENPSEAAAEHNIGFRPHVEHVEKGDTNNGNEVGGGGGGEEPLPENPTTKVKKHLATSPRETTTMDPDQMLIDLIDEQTLNLTAIEFEFMSNSSSMSPLSKGSSSTKSTAATDPKTSEKIVEFMDSNDISDMPPTSPSDLGMGNDSTILMEEMLPLPNASDSGENDNKNYYSNSTEFLLPLSSDTTSKVDTTSGTVEPTTESNAEGSKRALRNATHIAHVSGDHSNANHTEDEKIMISEDKNPAQVDSEADFPSNATSREDLTSPSMMGNNDTSTTSTPSLFSTAADSSPNTSFRTTTTATNSQTSYDEIYFSNDTEPSSNTIVSTEVVV